MSKSLLSLVAWIVGTSLGAVIGAVTARSASAFYAQLERPTWAPPAWAFGPAWTTLYVCMAVAAWRVWRIDGFEGARSELTLYAIQLALNALWSWFFFVRRTGLGATVDVICLLLMIIVTMIAFWKRDPIAGMLFVPYAIWVSFATALTIAVWRKNPTLL